MSHRLAPGSIEAQQRTLAMGVVLALPVAIGLWVGIDRLMPPVPGMATQIARALFALHCVGVAVLLALLPGIEAPSRAWTASINRPGTNSQSCSIVFCT